MLTVNLFNKWLFMLMIILLNNLSIYAQRTIRVLNIPIGTGNQPRSEGGESPYTLLQEFMINHSAPKLLNPNNFGVNGVVKNKLTIENGFNDFGTIKSANLLEPYDIIFIGSSNGYDNNKTFLFEEMNNILEWSSKPGNVLIVAEQSGLNPFTLHRNFLLKQAQDTNPSRPLKWQSNLIPNLSNGPFGVCESIYQNGTVQGYFENACNNIGVWWGANNQPTIIYDISYNDLYMADIDFFTLLNTEMQQGNKIERSIEIAWGNLWAWAISEVITPKPYNNIP